MNNDIYPVKFNFDDRTNEMDIYYRTENSHDLFKMSVPFEFYTFVSEDDADLFEEHEDVTPYRLLTDMSKKFYKKKLNAFRYRDIRQRKEFSFAEDLRAEERYIYDTYSTNPFPKNIQPRVHYIDIEVENLSGVLPSWENNMDEINAITVFDSYEKKLFSWFLKPGEFADITKKQLRAKFDDIIEVEKYDDMRDIDITINLVETPEDLIYDYIKWYTANMPDIITGWNISFDIPYIIRKVYDYYGAKGVKKLSPFFRMSSYVKTAIDSGTFRERETKIIPGVSNVDMMELCKKFYGSELPSWSLDNVSKEILKKGKVEYNGTLDQLYHQDFDRFCFYNMIDVMRVVEINEVKKYMGLVKTIRDISLTKYEDIFTMSKVVDGMFLQKAVQKRENGENIVLPTDIGMGGDKVKYCGAYVKNPLIGRHKCLSDLDYKSMYPSITYTFNISPETHRGMVVNWETLNYHRLKDAFDGISKEDMEHIFPESPHLIHEKDNRVYVNNKKKNIEICSYVKHHDNDKEYEYSYSTDDEIIIELKSSKILKMSYDKFKDWLHENSFNCLANGALFEQTDDVPILPSIMKGLMDLRDQSKGRREEFITERDKLEKGSPEWLRMDDEATGYDNLQWAYKIVGNSCYGVVSMSSFRLFSRPIAEGITSSGQIIIKSTEYLTNLFINKETGCKGHDQVVCIDTDSIIFSMEKLYPDFEPLKYTEEQVHSMKEYSFKVQNFINMMASKFSAILFYKPQNYDRDILKVKPEWIGLAILATGPKYYALKIVEQEGHMVNKLHVRGLAIRRSDYTQITKRLMSTVLEDYILSYRNEEETNQFLTDEIKKFKDYSLQELSCPTSVKNFEKVQYKTEGINVRATKIFNQYIARNELDKIRYGKIKWLYLKKWKNHPELNQDIDKFNVVAYPVDKPEYADIIANEIEVDWKSMKEKLIINPIEILYKPMKWTIPTEVISGSKASFGLFGKKRN